MNVKYWANKNFGNSENYIEVSSEGFEDVFNIGKLPLGIYHNDGEGSAEQIIFFDDSFGIVSSKHQSINLVPYRSIDNISIAETDKDVASNLKITLRNGSIIIVTMNGSREKIRDIFGGYAFFRKMKHLSELE